MAEWSVFRLVVSVIVAVALIAAIALYFAPLFQGPHTLSQQLDEKLSIAQNNPGESIALENVSLDQGTSFNSKQFNRNDRLIIFNCNDGSVCCARDSTQCNNGISWNANNLSGQKKLFTDASVRCNYAKSIYVCTIYFGNQPAQIQLGEIQFNKTVDLSVKNANSVGVPVKNIGKLSIASPVIVTGVLNRLQTNAQGIVTREKVRAFSETIQSLKPNETKTENLNTPIPSSGSFELQITAFGEDSGTQTKTIQFNAIGTIQSNCTTGNVGDLTFFGSTCKEQHFCSQCGNGTECVNAWIATEPNAQWELQTRDYAYKILPQETCNANS